MIRSAEQTRKLFSNRDIAYGSSSSRAAEGRPLQVAGIDHSLPTRGCDDGAPPARLPAADSADGIGGLERGGSVGRDQEMTWELGRKEARGVVEQAADLQSARGWRPN